MSRSYKKSPIAGDDKSNKDLANQKVRRMLKNQYDELIQKSSYKRCYPQYDICDYKSRCTFEEYCDFRARVFGESITCEADKKKMYKQWRKWYKGK